MEIYLEGLHHYSLSFNFAQTYFMGLSRFGELIIDK